MSYKDCFDQERRNFLRVVQRSGIAMGAIQASSLLAGVMMARVAEAQTGSPNKSVTVFMPGGCTPAKYFPTGTTLPTQSTPLQSHFSAGRVALLKNATMMNGGHGVMFNRFNDPNPWGKQSFDVNLGKVLSANSNAPVKWLNLGTTAVSELSRDNAGIPTITSPQAALDILFAGGGGGGGGTVAPRKSMVDFHYAAVNDLKAKLGQHEKQKLDSHFNAISEIEASIAATNPGGTCSAPPNTTAVGFDATSKLMTDIAVLALECSLSSSVSLAFGTDEHTHVLDGAMITDTTGAYRPRPSHDSHHNQGNPNYAGYYDQDVRYYMSLTAQLLDKLQAKNLLASTIVTQVSDMGNVDAHSGQNCPMLVAGGGVRGGVIDVGGLSQVALFQTVGLALKANQGANGALFRNWGASTISGLF
ncbi:DUF1552 domain-containing protein [Cellvibrio sp.]